MKLRKKKILILFSKESKTLDEIIKVKCSPLPKTYLGYSEGTSKAVNSSTEIGSYLNAVKISSQHHSIWQQKNKGQNTSQVKSSQFNQKENNTIRYYNLRHFYFNGQHFSCHKFFHKTDQCVTYRTLIITEARK